jgi:tetratricopeptide (TPR) repeat protein
VRAASHRAFVALALAVVADARAEPQARKHAVQLFQQGAAAYDAGRFQDAIQLLERAYALSPEPVILFNLGRSYEGLGQAEQAIDAYSRYLVADPGTADRHSIERRIQTLRAQLQERAALERERVEERGRAEEELAKARQTQVRVEPAPSRPGALPWVVGGVGAAGVAAGAVLGGIALSRHQSAVQDPFRASALARQASANQYATGANVAYAVGGALLAGGAVWIWIDHRSPAPSVAWGLSVAPGSVIVWGDF